MIKRINLIEKKTFALTYLRLVQIGAVMLAITACIIGFQVFNAKRLETKLEASKLVLQELEATRDKLMKTPVKKKVSVGEYQELMDRLEKTPNWSKLISDVTQKLPNTVWLTSFKSVGGLSVSAATASSPDKGNPKSYRDGDAPPPAETKPQVTGSYKLEVSGLSSAMKNVTEFVAALAQTKALSGIKVDSQKQSFGFSFTLVGDVNAR
ncbi:MAG TPA: PilN domain-containing protein [bacterium]|nr:PilN domain-containing protein [bacterium]